MTRYFYYCRYCEIKAFTYIAMFSTPEEDRETINSGNTTSLEPVDMKESWIDHIRMHYPWLSQMDVSYEKHFVRVFRQGKEVK